MQLLSKSNPASVGLGAAMEELWCQIMGRIAMSMLLMLLSKSRSRRDQAISETCVAGNGKRCEGVLSSLFRLHSNFTERNYRDTITSIPF